MPGSFEEFDDSAWDYGEQLFRAWKKALQGREVYEEIARKVAEHSIAKATKIYPPLKGAFNVVYRVDFLTGPHSAIRFPIPAYFRYAEEKLQAEVAVMRYVADHTSIPIPLVLHSGTREESPRQLGPFLIVEWVDHACDMADVLNAPGIQRPLLNPNIGEGELVHMYSQMADILLQLSKCEFAAIGSLNIVQEDREPEVMRRALSLNLSQLVNFSRIPHYKLPNLSRTFSDSAEYYSELADMHLQQLSFQRNQAIDSAADCQRKYIARYVMTWLPSMPNHFAH